MAAPLYFVLKCQSSQPIDITSAAFILLITAREFPSNVVIVAIVQPGVPTGQRYTALTTNKDQVLMVPDNGLATLVIKEMGIKSLYEINNRESLQGAGGYAFLFGNFGKGRRTGSSRGSSPRSSALYWPNL